MYVLVASGPDGRHGLGSAFGIISRPLAYLVPSNELITFASGHERCYSSTESRGRTARITPWLALPMLLRVRSNELSTLLCSPTAPIVARPPSRSIALYYTNPGLTLRSRGSCGRMNGTPGRARRPCSPPNRRANLV